MRSISFDSELCRSHYPGRCCYFALKIKCMNHRTTYLNQHRQHIAWLNYLAFYKDEMQVLQKRLEELAVKHPDGDVPAQIEHFQNQLILQREQHDILRHDIKQFENKIEELYERDPVLAANSRPKEEAGLNDRMETFSRLFHEMKDELYHFAARHW